MAFLEKEVMRRTAMPITQAIIWLQGEQKAGAQTPAAPEV
jgi:hypothetical protein